MKRCVSLDLRCETTPDAHDAQVFLYVASNRVQRGVDGALAQREAA